MDHIAGWSSSQRRDLFLDTAERHGEVRLPGLVEKDFWVCWCLHRLFRDDRPPRLLFKGGTSLSKVYGVIQRLSEDIDLSIDRAWFGFSEERDPANARSNKHARRLLSELREVCATYVTGELLQRLADDFGAVLGERGADATGWSLMPDLRDRDRQTLLFRYPSTEVTLATDAYVAPDIRLELGARSDHWPVSSGEVRPYAAEAFREEFE